MNTTILKEEGLIINWQPFEFFLHEKMKQENIPGVAVAASINGEIIYSKGFGYRNVNKKEKVTPSTIFGVASVTKSFTALAIMLLEEEGKLSATDSVVKHLPELMIPGVEDMADIKIYHLLSHTTGLAPLERREDFNQIKDHITYLTHEHELLGKPGDYFSYCNDSFILLGAIIERITGKLFRRHLTEVLLNRIGMYRTTMSLEEVAKYEDVSTPYIWNKDQECLEEQAWPTLGNYEVGGGIRSNALDLLKYGEIYTMNKPAIIAQETIRKMWSDPFPVTEDSYYGYGFKVTPNYCGENMTLVEHGGGQPGVSSNFGFVPEKGIVVTVLCNVSNVSADDIWLQAMNTVLALPLEQKRIAYTITEVSPQKAKRYIGSYHSNEGNTASIIIEDDQLKLKSNGEKYILKGCTERENTFIIETTGKTISFFLDDKDEAWAVLLGSRMLTKKG
ncbi:serine hydrolase domain-containing protein [Evansella cellulosilytica]|uniref:Beta-lactamase n=1 Tax=Evansella cellulosilytica (strain ATCC 21833 / DSM 2522 / FERM P-1141 / JCM 9156 / N-4) TaxID=649639 RepID=E6TRT0_EVAC2|nr:serine hydrolase domain-containing protein [Evansella cellulosilytica]ADU29453.1 beta-lactamase [Evansella cellulosilytica DSM 2522]